MVIITTVLVLGCHLNDLLLQLQKNCKQQPIPSLHSLHFNPGEVSMAPHPVKPATSHHCLRSCLVIKVLVHPLSLVLDRPQHNHLYTTLHTNSSRVSPRSSSAYVRQTGSVIAIASSEKNKTARFGKQHGRIRNELRRNWQKRERKRREIG